MSEQSKLEKAFNAYLILAKAELRPRQVSPSNVLPLKLIKNPWEELRDLVEGLEMRPEFGELVKQTLVAEDSGEETEEQADSRSDEIQNFFRRSRCYMSIYDGQNIDLTAIFESFNEAFHKADFEIRYLVALGGINFQTDNDIIEFERFQIRRFSIEELNEIFQNDVNEVFYQDRV